MPSDSAQGAARWVWPPGSATGWLSRGDLVPSDGPSISPTRRCRTRPRPTRPQRTFFVKRDGAEKVEASATSVSRVRLTPDQTNGRYSIIDEIFQPGMRSPSHRHAYYSETFHRARGQDAVDRRRRDGRDRGGRPGLHSPRHVALGPGGRRRARPRDHALRTRRVPDRVASSRRDPTRGRVGRTRGARPPPNPFVDFIPDERRPELAGGLHAVPRTPLRLSPITLHAAPAWWMSAGSCGPTHKIQSATPRPI